MLLALRPEYPWFIGKAAVINMLSLQVWDCVPRALFTENYSYARLSAPITKQLSFAIPTVFEVSTTEADLAPSCRTWPEHPLRLKGGINLCFILQHFYVKKNHCCHKVRSRGEMICMFLFRVERVLSVIFMQPIRILTSLWQWHEGQTGSVCRENTRKRQHLWGYVERIMWCTQKIFMCKSASTSC